MDQPNQELFLKSGQSVKQQSVAQVYSVLNKHLSGLEETALLELLITVIFPSRIAVASSFGAESAVLLHMISRIDPSLPVLFGDTDKLFPETLAYKHQLTDLFGLTDVRQIKPELSSIQTEDSEGTLWQSDPDRCCTLRKVIPFQTALNGFSAWITGRKRFQGETRSSLDILELDGERLKINPLAQWSIEKIEDYMKSHNLPDHPLKRFGYLSLGCTTCTRAVREGEDQRAGRWSGLDKIECGIHFINGQAVPRRSGDGST